MLPQRVLFALGVLAAAVSAQTCPDGIRLLFKPTPSAPTHGKDMKVQYTLVNKSKMKIDNMNVTIALPDTVTYKSSGMKNGVNKGTAGAVTTLATGVTWVNAGALAAGKSSIYWAEATVHPQADLLMFAGAAELTINGQTCTLVPPANAVRTKGYKHAVPTTPGTPPSLPYNYPVAARLDCANGYKEQILFSAEGIELVVAAWKGGAAGVPAPLLANAGQYDFSTSNTELNYAMFLRPSALSTAGPVAIDEWWGVNDNTPGDFIGTAAGAYMLSSTTWLLWQSSHDSWTGGNKGYDYFDYYTSLGNDMNGAIHLEYYGGTWSANVNSGDQDVIYMVANVIYQPSGTVLPHVVAA